MSPPSLTQLLKSTHISSPEDFLQSATVVLKENKSDLVAQRARLVALVKLERYDDALKHVEEGGSQLQHAAPVEYAYALYKSNRFADAQRIANADTDNRGLLHVAAQAAYRKEAFEEAARIYKELAASEGDEDFDLRIQRSAVDAQLEWSGNSGSVEHKKPSREDLDAFESAYNAACGCIARGELSQASVLLSRAKQLCNASPDLSDEDKAAELIPICIQQSYVALVLGQHQEAAKIINDVNVEDLTDLSLRHIAKINSMASTAQTNPFLSHRTFHSSPPIPKKDAPFRFQGSIIQHNEYALDLQNGKFAGTAKSTSRALSSESLAEDDTALSVLSVINAAAKSHNQTGNSAIKTITPLLESQPANIGVLLLLAQLYCLKGSQASAIAIVEQFFKHVESSASASAQSLRFSPGLVAVAVAIYNAQGRTSQSRSLLEAAASFWQTTSSSGGAAPNAALLRAAGSALLQSGNSDDAAAAEKIFADLHSRNSHDKAAIAGLVAARSFTDASKLDPALLKSLTPHSRLTATIDAAELEAAGIARLPADSIIDSRKKRGVDTTGATTDGAAATQNKKRRKLPKSRVPKDFVEGKTPDPDRWLPLRDRSTWRPKGGKKGKAKAATLTQGGVVVDDDAKQGQQQQAKADGTKTAGGNTGGQARKNNNGAKKKAKGGKR